MHKSSSSATRIGRLQPPPRSPPLDLHSVNHDYVSLPSSGFVHGAPHCPIYYPSLAEFSDPLAYIRKIKPHAEQAGICKIVPPREWNPGFALDTETFRFRTRKQLINELDGSTRSSLNFVETLQKFHALMGHPLTHMPSIQKKPVDLYALRSHVQKRGGFKLVSENRKWTDIGRELGLVPTGSLPSLLKTCYQKYILPFDDYMSQVEATPGQSTAQLYNEISKSDVDFLKPNGAGPQPQEEEDESGANPIEQSKTAVEPEAAAAHDQDETESADRRRTSTRLQQARDQSNGHSTNKGAPYKVPPEAALPPVPLPENYQPIPNEELCEVCGHGHNPQLMAICEECHRGYHAFCLTPHLPVHPQSLSEWYCEYCVADTGKEFGFEDGDVYSMSEFKKKADEFKSNWFKQRARGDAEAHGLTPGNRKLYVTEEEVEREFWRLVESPYEDVEVEYGADLHTSVHGSGFPTPERDPHNPYSKNPFNLNVLPLLSDSLLSHVQRDISGVVVPWMYIGMPFSTFCWHTEDHSCYSVNYQHWGDTKTWYSVPASDANKLEECMRENAPELFAKNPDLMFHITTMLSPAKLLEYGVRVVGCHQRAGEFVITFPQAYHGGFNHGFNCNEAVNFAPADWLEFGLSSVKRYREFHRPSCFSHDELLMSVALKQGHELKTALWLATHLRELLERCEREHHQIQSRGLPIEFITDPTDTCNTQCIMCKQFCWFAEIRCANDPAHPPTCLEHMNYIPPPPPTPKVIMSPSKSALQAPTIPVLDDLDAGLIFTEDGSSDPSTAPAPINDIATAKTANRRKYTIAPGVPAVPCLCPIESSKIVRLRYKIDDLRAIVDQVTEISQVPARWVAQFREQCLEHATNGTKPSVKELSDMIASADRIPVPIEEAVTLRAHLQRALEWIESASKFLRTSASSARPRSGKRASQANIHSNQQQQEYPTRLSLQQLEHMAHEGQQLYIDAPEVQAIAELLSQSRQLNEQGIALISRQYPATVDECNAYITACARLDVDMPHVEGVKHLVKELQWRSRALAFSSSNVASSVDVNLKARPRHEDFQKLLTLIDEAEMLGVDPYDELYSLLRDQKARGETWNMRATEVLSMDKLSVQELDELAETSHDAPINRAIMTRVLELHSKIHDWFNQADQLLNPDTRASADQLKSLINRMHGLPIEPPESYEILSQEMRKVEAWAMKVKKIFVKPNTPKGLESILAEAMVHFSAVCDTERDVCVAMDDPARHLYCFCRTPDSGYMLGCEICGEFYHCQCIKLTKREAKKMTYVCSVCDTTQPVPRRNGPGSYASLSELEEIVEEGRTLKFIPPELPTLERILEAVHNLQRTIQDFLQQRDQFTMLDLSHIKFYLRKAEGCEIAIPEIARLRELVDQLAMVRAVSMEKFCICQKPATPLVSMVACDECNDWFHFPCVLLTAKDMRHAESYTCPVCCYKKGKPYPLGKVDIPTTYPPFMQFVMTHKPAFEQRAIERAERAGRAERKRRKDADFVSIDEIDDMLSPPKRRRASGRATGGLATSVANAPIANLSLSDVSLASGTPAPSISALLFGDSSVNVSTISIPSLTTTASGIPPPEMPAQPGGATGSKKRRKSSAVENETAASRKSSTAKRAAKPKVPKAATPTGSLSTYNRYSEPFDYPTYSAAGGAGLPTTGPHAQPALQQLNPDGSMGLSLPTSGATTAAAAPGTQLESGAGSASMTPVYESSIAQSVSNVYANVLPSGMPFGQPNLPSMAAHMMGAASPFGFPYPAMASMAASYFGHYFPQATAAAAAHFGAAAAPFAPAGAAAAAPSTSTADDANGGTATSGADAAQAAAAAAPMGMWPGAYPGFFGAYPTATPFGSATAAATPPVQQTTPAAATESPAK